MIYVLTIKSYDWHEFTDVLTASSDMEVVLNYAKDTYPNLEVYLEDSAVYAEFKQNMSTETAHLTILVFND